MAFKVGIPCLKCSLKPSQQINKKTGKKSKTCGIESAWLEMNDDRLGRDETIDKSLTQNNVWMKGSTSDDVNQIVEGEINRINLERKDNGLRSLRSDAVSVVEIIEKPPIDYMQALTYEEKIKFLSDSHNVMTNLLHEWNPNWKVLESVQHHDEFGGLSAHNHTLVMLTSIDKNGIATMRAKDEFNLKFFSYINKNYPQQMRNLGYDVEDCLTFDKLSDEEKMERKLHPEKHGVDAYIYKQQKAKEQEQLLSHLNHESSELSNKLNAKRSELSDVEQELANKKAAISDINKSIEASRQREIKNNQKEAILTSKLNEIEELKSDYAAKVQSANHKEKIFTEKLQQLTGTSDIRTYNSVIKENELLKKELKQKETIIETLKQNYDKLKRSLDEWKYKFQDISQKAGAKLMAFFGYDVGQDIQPYPIKQITDGINSMFIEAKDSRQYRVIPDDTEPGKFRIVNKNADGKYQTIIDGFTTRTEAEKYRNGLINSGLTFKNELKINNGIKL